MESDSSSQETAYVKRSRSDSSRSASPRPGRPSLSRLTRAAATPFQCFALDDEDDARRSREIDRYLQEEGVKRDRQLKVIIFGSVDEVDVFWKQARLLATPLSQEEREGLRPEVKQNVLNTCTSYLQELLDGEIPRKAKEMGPLLSSTVTRLEKMISETLDSSIGQDERARRVISLDQDEAFHSLLHQLGITWDDLQDAGLPCCNASFATCVVCGPDAGPGIAKHLARVYAPAYTPSDHDWLHFDRRICGVYAREAHVERGTHALRLLDMCGRRGERKKWIHLFDDSACVVFVADLALYNQLLFEDASANRFQEMLCLLESIYHSTIFKDAPVLIVPCNVSAFKRRLRKSPLERHFPLFKGGTEQEAVDFMVGLLTAVCAGGRKVHVHPSDVADAESMQRILDCIDGEVLRPRLEGLGVFS